MLTLKAYEILKARLGEEKASTLIGYIDEKFKEKMIRDKAVFLTKDAKSDLIKWMIGFWIVQIIRAVSTAPSLINALRCPSEAQNRPDRSTEPRVSF